MTTARVRRGLLLPVLALAVLLAGAPGAASAAFVTRVTAAATTTTATVAPPTSLTTAGSTTCVLSLTTSYTVRVSWTASSTARVSGYRVTETVNGTPRAVVPVAATTFTRTATKALVGTATHSFSVVAVTDYGWLSVPAVVGYTC